MPFNATTYHANRTARQAWECLAKARELRERQAAAVEIESAVKLARIKMRQHIGWRRIQKLG